MVVGTTNVNTQTTQQKPRCNILFDVFINTFEQNIVQKRGQTKHVYCILNAAITLRGVEKMNFGQ